MKTVRNAVLTMKFIIPSHQAALILSLACDGVRMPVLYSTLLSPIKINDAP